MKASNSDRAREPFGQTLEDYRSLVETAANDNCAQRGKALHSSDDSNRRFSFGAAEEELMPTHSHVYVDHETHRDVGAAIFAIALVAACSYLAGRIMHIW